MPRRHWGRRRQRGRDRTPATIRPYRRRPPPPQAAGRLPIADTERIRHVRDVRQRIWRPLVSAGCVTTPTSPATRTPPLRDSNVRGELRRPQNLRAIVRRRAESHGKPGQRGSLPRPLRLTHASGNAGTAPPAPAAYTRPPRDSRSAEPTEPQ